MKQQGLQDDVIRTSTEEEKENLKTIPIINAKGETGTSNKISRYMEFRQ